MTKELRVAILGGGRMAQQHATAIRLQPQARFVAVGDPYLSAEEIKERFGADVEGYKSAEELLAKAKPDVVHIVSPPHTHFDLAKLCLSNGASVYVEKPFAPTAREAAELIDLAESKNLRVCSAHQVLFQRAGQHYQTFLPKIGDLIHVESYFSFKPVRRRPDGGTPLSAIDQLVDILPHPVYLMLSALERDANAHPELTALDVAPEGEVRAVIRSGGTLATLIVSLRARPVESYLRVVGVNGSVTADFILGDVVTSLGPGASAPAVVLKPFSTAWQKYWGSYAGVFRLLFRRQKSYPGLGELLTLLYASVRDPNAAPPLSRRNIMNTVTICEQIAAKLAVAESRAEELARQKFDEASSKVSPPDPTRGTVFVTGGSGFLGKRVLEELRNDGWHVRAAVRRTPAARARVPGIEYVEADLGRGIDPSLLAGTTVVAHCAAETAGNQQAHERNTVVATTKLLDAMEAAGVKKLINIGSVAVLKAGPSVQREDSVVDRGNLGRGPYVWAKAEAECLADDRAKKGTVEVRTVRLGPLVDFSDYTPPGRLGRDIAKTFIGMGSRGNALSVLDTQTAARVIRWYADEFESAPRCVNLVEVPATTRGQLADRMKATRPELRFFWLPFWLLKLLSWFAIGLQKMLKPKAPALDVYAAFKSEKYDPAISQRVIAAAGPARPPRVAA